MTGKKNKVEMIEKNILISQRCYPTAENLDTMKLFVDAIEDIYLHRLVTTILITGTRVCEAMNGFYYLNDEGKTIFQCPIEKKQRLTKWKMPDVVVSKEGAARGFLGKEYLEERLDPHKFPFWRSKKIMNPFGLEVGWINDILSHSPFEPNWMFEGCGKASYSEIYKKFKEISRLKVTYYYEKNDLMEPGKEFHNVSFHWLRKSFCAQVIRLGWMNVAQLSRYIKWERIDTSMRYLKLDTESNEYLQDLDSVYRKKKRFD